MPVLPVEVIGTPSRAGTEGGAVEIVVRRVDTTLLEGRRGIVSPGKEEVEDRDAVLGRLHRRQLRPLSLCRMLTGGRIATGQDHEALAALRCAVLRQR